MLTVEMCKNFIPTKKVVIKTDSKGLFLKIQPDGGKYWLFRYRFAGKQKSVHIGRYLDISLEEARKQRDELRAAVKEGRDPALEKKLAKLRQKVIMEHTLESVCREFMEKKKSKLTPKNHKLELSRLEKYILPFLGSIPINMIKPVDLLAVLQKIETKGKAETCLRVKSIVGQVYRYGVATGVAERDITPDLKGALTRSNVVHHPYLTRKEFHIFLRRIPDFNTSDNLRLAIKLLVLTFVRSIELRGARWEEFDLKTRLWTISPERMKNRRPHIVPLSSYSIVVLYELKELSKGETGLLFPNINGIERPISDSTLSKILRTNGYRDTLTPHGIRATASTILHGSLNSHRLFSSVHIERQLSHYDNNRIRGVYNHFDYLEDRVTMMEWWGDYVKEISLLPIINNSN
jgi:integrase